MLIYKLLFSWYILNQGRCRQIESGAAAIRQKKSILVVSSVTKTYNIAEWYDCPGERLNLIRLFYLIENNTCVCSHADSNDNYSRKAY